MGYIGVYSGPVYANGQPDPSAENFKELWGYETFEELFATWSLTDWSGWQKYFGERGYSCTETVYYAVSDSSNKPPVGDEETDLNNLEPF
jgi:hypothetical protein